MTARAAVIGAGISGLALGWHLKESSGIDLKIYERSDRCGGWIATDFINGFLFERGPRSCRTRGAGRATLELIEALGLEEEVIAASPSANRRYLYLDKQVQPLPHSLSTFFRSPLMKGVSLGILRDLFQRRGTGDETVGTFFSRRIGAQLTDRLIDPLVSGIYAGDINALSIRACFPEFYRCEKERGSLLLGMLLRKKNSQENTPFVESMSKQPIFSFRNGMETLVKALSSRLKSHIALTQNVRELRRHTSGVEVVMDDGSVELADKVFAAIQPAQACRLIERESPVAAKLMSAIPAATAAVVNLGWKDKVLDREGFGYLIPQSEKEPVLGVVWDSSVFPEQNGSAGKTRLTVMLGGTNHPEVCSLSQEDLLGIASDALKRHLGIIRPHDAVKVSIAHGAIPQYVVGHLERLDKIERLLNEAFDGRVVLAGSGWRGVAVNDCIAEAKALAAR